MITVTRIPGGVRRIDVCVTRPTVYLDHWAIRRLADDPDLGQRFHGCADAGATLALSWINAYEFLGNADGPSVERADAFLRGVGTSFFFLDCDPIDVLKRADGDPWQEQRVAHDEEFARAFIAALDPADGPLTLDGFIAGTRDARAAARGSMRDALAGAAADMERARTFLRNRSASKRAPLRGGSRVDHYLTTLTREVLFTDRPVRRNDIADLFHAVVALALCDFVLLDKHWAAQAEKAPYPQDPPRVYAPKSGQVEAFLSKLEETLAARGAE